MISWNERIEEIKEQQRLIREKYKLPRVVKVINNLGYCTLKGVKPHTHVKVLEGFNGTETEFEVVPASWSDTSKKYRSTWIKQKEDLDL